MINILALRKTKREGFSDNKGNIVDDGTNSQISLWANCPNASLAKFFLGRIKNNVKGRDWNVWIETT